MGPGDLVRLANIPEQHHPDFYQLLAIFRLGTICEVKYVATRKHHAVLEEDYAYIFPLELNKGFWYPLKDLEVMFSK
jgi:hypothetical protein